MLRPWMVNLVIWFPLVKPLSYPLQCHCRMDLLSQGHHGKHLVGWFLPHCSFLVGCSLVLERTSLSAAGWVLVSCLQCLLHRVVLQVKCNYVKVRWEPSNRLRWWGGRTEQVKTEGWKSVCLQLGCSLKAGVAVAGTQVCLPAALTDWGTCRHTSHAGRQARPTDGHSHSFGDCHS